MNKLHRKTAKGHSEVRLRQHRLGMRVRAALILVDGLRDDDEICQLLGPQAREWLIELTWQNMIEPVPLRDSAGGTLPGSVLQRSAASRSQVSTTVSGFKDIEAMPSWASQSAKSG